MVMIKRMLALLGSGALAILLLRQAETAAQAVRDGIQLCLTSVIPALFPFFAVSSLLVALGAAEAAGRALARPFGRLFRCGGAGCAALLLELGFAQRELLTEFGYPTQRLVLLPRGEEGRDDR